MTEEKAKKAGFFSRLFKRDRLAEEPETEEMEPEEPEMGPAAEVVEAEPLPEVAEELLVEPSEGPEAEVAAWIAGTGPLPARYAFIDGIETGTRQATPQLDRLAGAMRKELDGVRDEIRALGTGRLEHYIEDYFPHMWADPEQAKRVARIADGVIVGSRLIQLMAAETDFQPSVSHFIQGLRQALDESSQEKT